MDVRLAFPNDYIGAADLRGRSVCLTISAVTMELLRNESGREQERPVLGFRELEERPRPPHRFVLNKTNAMAIAKIAGTYEMDEWIGVRIVLYPTTTEAFGEIVDCIRVRAPAPKAGEEPGGLEALEEEELGG